MAYLGPNPSCAARKCPATSREGCVRYIAENSHNQTAQNFVACCKVECGDRSNNEAWLWALECGGATTATAVGTVLYLLILLLVGGYIIAVGPFLRVKTITFYVVTIGSLIFTTGTGVFVTNVTSPFMVLESFPALGAMNVAVFSYFYSGFKYGVGLAYEGGPLVVFITTSVTILKALDDEKEDGPIRTGNNLAVAMLVFTVVWIIHSVSYRLYGYRVDWRLGQKWPNHDADVDQQDPRFHLGAAQGHPTWRTPLGQSTSVVMTGLAWSMVRVVYQDLALQQCRPDWVFHTMLLGAPILISATILWNIFSGARCRTITGLTVRPNHGHNPPPTGLRKWLIRAGLLPPQRHENYTRFVTTSSQYPGYSSYKYFMDSNFHPDRPDSIFYHDRPDRKRRFYVLGEYVQAAALQGMERNSLSVEEVHHERLACSDKLIGLIAWFLAQIGLLISIPAFFSLMLVTELFGFLLEVIRFRILVVTEVTETDRTSAAAVVEQCCVGQQLADSPRTWASMEHSVLGNRSAQRSTNLHTLLDNTGPAELYNVLTLPGLRNPTP